MANGGIIGTVNNPTSTTATGVWQQEEQYEAKVTDTWPQRALFTTKSCRFNENDDCLIKTFGSAGNRKKWTFSLWFKRGKLGSSYALFVAGASGNDEATIRIEADKIDWQNYDVGTSAQDSQLLTTQVIRDPSAWYHLVCVYDSANATAGDRMKMFLNGSEITSFSTDNNPSLNYDSAINNNVLHNIGRQSWNSSADFSGYMSEVVLIDGQALDPTSFGVANSDGVWTPIPYTGTFGTNGFNLQFEDAAALGTDSSPNGNTFTVNNLTSIDQSTDYPVVNYATLNGVAIGLDATLSEGNLKMASGTATTRSGTASTIGLSQGKWFAEFKITQSASGIVGIVGTTQNRSATDDDDIGNYPGRTQQGYGYLSGGSVYNDSSAVTGSFASFTTNDIIGVAVDLDGDLLYFYKNGAIQNSGTGIDISGITTQSGNWFFAVGDGSAGTASTVECNFGSPPFAISSGNADGNGYGNFEYAVPSGYYALNTKNLAEFG